MMTPRRDRLPRSSLPRLRSLTNLSRWESESATLSANSYWRRAGVDAALFPGRDRCPKVRRTLSGGNADGQYSGVLPDWVVGGIPEPPCEPQSRVEIFDPSGIYRRLLHVLDLRVGDMVGYFERRVLDWDSLRRRQPGGGIRRRRCWGGGSSGGSVIRGFLLGSDEGEGREQDDDGVAIERVARLGV